MSSNSSIESVDVTAFSNLDHAYERFKDSYERSDHFQELRDLLQPEAWTIDRIVIMGIGNPPTLPHLYMILKLRDWLQRTYNTNTTVEVYSQGII